MFIAKGLLIKGLGGLGALVGSGALVFGIHKIFSNSDNTEINKKITEILKLPDGCKFTGNESNNTKECTLTEDQLKKIKFKNIEGESITVTGLANSETITLEIKKFNNPTEEDKKRYKIDLSSNDLWFTFKTESITTDITIKKSENDTNNQIKLIKGTNPEFKINNDKLEKAWTVTELAKKVNLKCPATEGDTEKKCTVETGATISYKNNNEIKKLTTTAQSSNEITYTEDQQNYNQGFKFNVSTAISGNSNLSLATGNYEIKYEAGENKGWYLAKKTNGGT